MKIYIKIFILLLLFENLYSYDADEILKKVDENLFYETIKYDGTMKIKKPNRPNEIIKTFKAFAKGKNKFFIEFTNPGDRGTRYLKLKNELWVKGAYAERADKISGHLLREPMMGSDFSYEDAMENEKLIEKYLPKIVGTEIVNNQECIKLELTAKLKEINYPKRILWVSEKNFVPLKIQYFALSGILLKEMEVLEIRNFDGKYLPTKIKMINKQRDSYTLFEMENVILNKPLSDNIFSKQKLEE
jgi:outer membrane lipoprotein-sorting protein